MEPSRLDLFWPHEWRVFTLSSLDATLWAICWYSLAQHQQCCMLLLLDQVPYSKHPIPIEILPISMSSKFGTHHPWQNYVHILFLLSWFFFFFQAVSFKKNSTAIARKMWWKDKKTTIVIGLVVLVSELIKFNYSMHLCLHDLKFGLMTIQYLSRLTG